MDSGRARGHANTYLRSLPDMQEIVAWHHSDGPDKAGKVIANCWGTKYPDRAIRKLVKSLPSCIYGASMQIWSRSMAVALASTITASSKT